MSNTLQDTFKDLRDLPIDYSSANFTNNYWQIALDIDIDKYLGYSNEHKQYMPLHPESNIFHIILSVKVSEDSDFIPFFSLMDSTGTVDETVRQNVNRNGKSDIKYNYSEFLSDFKTFNKKYGGLDAEVPRCSFTVEQTKKEITDFCFISKIPNQGFWFEENPNTDKNVSELNKDGNGTGDKALQELNDKLLGQEPSFVKFFSDYYKKQYGVDKLKYSFFNMDADFKSDECLTRLMIISTDKDEATYFMKLNLNKIREIVSYIRSRYVSDLIKKNRYESIRSAKAAIMSRNLSHNLGSHVMFYIKQKLESVDKILTNEVLLELVDISSSQTPDYNRLIEKIKRICESESGNNDSNNNTKEILEMPFLIGLGRFLNYLQERQDFIATVATNYIPFCTTINFKDAIYDELKPEIRAMRHSTDSDTVNKSANLLLDYIAYSEGFTSSNSIQLLFPNDKEKQDKEKYFSGGYKPEDVPAGLREFNVALPGGNMGRQAFFSIMENIIRNTAKHDGSLAENGTLQFQFDKINAEDIKSILGYSWRQGERNEHTDELNCSCYTDHQNNLYYLGITVNLKGDVSDDTLKGIAKGLRQPYITSDGQMDEECKGLKEIRISAAWLRGKELDDEFTIEEPPAVAIRKEEGKLQYIICLPKPKRVAFIHHVKKDDKVSQNLCKEGIDEFGCRVFDLLGFNEKKQIADFDLIICSDSDFDSIRPYVGSKVFVTDVDRSITAYYSTDLKENYIEELYKSWMNQAFSSEKDVKISICDAKAEKANINTSSSILDGIIHCGSSSTTDSLYYEDRVLFSTHYEGQAAVMQNGDKNCGFFPKARFVEAISGGDSTDRLIRHDKRNAEWYCRHKAAGLSQVAIFDERLYSMLMPEDKLEIKKTVINYLRDNPSADSSDFAYIEFNNGRTLSDSQMTAVEDYLKGRVLNEENCINSLRFLFPNYSKTWQYREKCIWIFNIRVRDINPETDNDSTEEQYSDVEIVGYSAAPTRGKIGTYNEDFREMTIAHIIRVGDEIRIVKKLSDEFMDENFEYKNKYDFISIHQGLLDKIYGALNIDKKDAAKKELVTKALFDAFSNKANHKEAGVEIKGSEIVVRTERIKNENDEEVENKYFFLPQFIIHSGRSKPNKDDMPQHLPFLQFSAIDHAIRDCKYTLTELLYAAHYEQ